jgi:molecular chaperone GrpE
MPRAMSKKKIRERDREPARSERDGGDAGDQEFKVEDRRHWQQEASPDEDRPAEAVEVAPAKPSVLDEFRDRAESAERKLLEYIEAFKRHQADHEQLRERLARDVDRRVDLKFGQLVGELLETLDDLDLSLEHVQGVKEAEPLAKGVAMARDRFLNTLQKHGVERISPEGMPFDPNEAEAIRVDPVDSAEADQHVTETVKPGYRLGDRVIRAAKVAVGRRKRSG